MDYHYPNQYYYYPSEDHPNYQVDLPPYHLLRDFNPPYNSPYYSFPSYDHFPPQFTSSYYVSGFSDCSESILVDPAGDSTRFVVSYSVSSKFNEPEFKEYDPTPYAGGYDPSATYGVPLVPSDEICYPRSTQGGTIPILKVPSGEADKIPKDDRGGQKVAPTRDEEEEPAPVIIQAPPLGNTNAITDDNREERESAGGTEEIPKHVPYQPSPVVPGCGMDAVDICDGVFGYYWPCWEREVNRRRNDEMGNQNSHHHHHRHHHERGYWAGGKSSQDWQIRTADYLFGSSNPYDNDNTNYGGPASVYSGYWP